MYYLKIFIIEKCSYCDKLLILLKKYKKIRIDVVNIKEKNKNKFKTKDIKTFPQIYLKKNNSNGSLLIGGYDDIKYIENSIINDIDKSYKIIKKKYNNFSKKSILRIIELLS